ncbi:MAG TPA: aminoglycoside phosphotransferase family protein [Alphaproteobacteria bacterium]|nr:aminoglycoside phosphotransferase family protein [Alphaproteobacteria bacterium]
MNESHAQDPAEEEARAALVRFGLIAADAHPRFERLTGGVASDIWKVELPRGPVCVKRALAKLRVAQDWRAPTARNANEVAWMQAAGKVVPDAVPEIFLADPDNNLFVMAYLDPATHHLWKQQLRDGIAETATAVAVANRLVRIHGATAGDPVVAKRFAMDEIFYAIRLEPYLVATARHYEALGESDVAAALDDLVAVTAASKRCLVHGDVSPKNILIGPRGPVFLDAECAWYGDPAFDLAFCLNHLLLKCLWRRQSAGGFLSCFDALAATYLKGVRWEPIAELERRTANLLPGLFLARVDGKSPVEYLTADKDKNRVRKIATMLLRRPVARLSEVRAAWGRELGI